jgi:hypothetical protein
MTTLDPPMTRRIALITTVLALALPLSSAIPAAAQQNPFGPLPQAAPTETPTPTAVSSAGDNSTGRNTLFIIGGALIVGFGVIGWFIMRDARAALPEEELASLSRLREQGPHAHKRQAKAKARAKTRHQKAARKHNRPRR